MCASIYNAFAYIINSVVIFSDLFTFAQFFECINNICTIDVKNRCVF